MNVKERYRGYLKVNNTREYLKKIGDEYKFFVFSDDHLYNVIEETECFDKKGNILGVFKNEKNIRKTEEKELEKQLQVIQYNYNFYLLPLGCVSTMDEVSDAYRLIDSVFNIKDVKNYHEHFNRDNALYRFHYDEIDIKNKRPYIPYDYKENFTPFEIVKLGFSREIINVTNKKLFDLDVKEYTKRKNDFIEQNPEYKRQVEFIYKMNIGHLSLFWGVPIKSLLGDNFNRNIQAINKLNRKITIKNREL
tara:strand:+ start:30 stop:776 length:747 start_codon:yes stop_codon:yes gene_type:complete